MKNLRKWTALAAVMAMTATLFTGCGSTDAPLPRQQHLQRKVPQQQPQKQERKLLQQTASWQQTYRQS